MADRPLHILIVGIKWPPETFIARLIQGLLEQGLTITVATHTKPDEQWRQQPGFHWLFTPLWEGGVGWRLLYLISLMFRALLLSPRTVRLFTIRPFLMNWYQLLPFIGRQWDAIYFPWNSAAVSYLPLFDLGYPVVISCRGSQINVAPHNPQRAAFVEGLKETLRRATAVHCVSDHIRKEAMKYGLDPEKTRVIRPAVDPDFFCPPTIDQQSTSSLRLITVGSLLWRKGYEYALLAVRQLLDDGVAVCLDIIGDGHERQRVLYTIEDLGLQEAVVVNGRLTPEQIRHKLQQADIFLLTSLSEGISNAALEAMACGLPVVTTNCGGMREAICHGREGFVTPIGDPQAMAQALHTLFQSPDLCQQMGQAGRRRIEKEFNLSHQIQQFEALFQEAVQLKQTQVSA